MKIVSTQDRGYEYGRRYQQRQYEIQVSAWDSQVRVDFKNLGERVESRRRPKGGFLVLPSPVAARIAHAMLLASSGPLKEAAVFEVDEDKIT